MRSMPNSVSFWTTHSGRSPLVGANATVSAGAGAGSNCTLPSPPSAGVVVHRTERAAVAARPEGAGPVSGAVADDDLLAGPQPEHATDVVQVVGRKDGMRHVVDEHLRRRCRTDRDGGELG